jgi:deoxyribodipyrimidine photolyase-like uncharacterized protein
MTMQLKNLDRLSDEERRAIRQQAAALQQRVP